MRSCEVKSEIAPLSTCGTPQSIVDELSPEWTRIQFGEDAVYGFSFAVVCLVTYVCVCVCVPSVFRRFVPVPTFVMISLCGATAGREKNIFK